MAKMCTGSYSGLGRAKKILIIRAGRIINVNPVELEKDPEVPIYTIGCIACKKTLRVH